MERNMHGTSARWARLTFWVAIFSSTYVVIKLCRISRLNLFKLVISRGLWSIWWESNKKHDFENNDLVWQPSAWFHAEHFWKFLYTGDWIAACCFQKVKGGREGRPIGAYELAKAVEALGAGEILLNCIDCDGNASHVTYHVLYLLSGHILYLISQYYARKLTWRCLWT